MECRKKSAHKFRTRLGFKQYDVILTKEQSELTEILSSFKRENMQTQHNVTPELVPRNCLRYLQTKKKKKEKKLKTFLQVFTRNLS